MIFSETSLITSFAISATASPAETAPSIAAAPAAASAARPAAPTIPAAPIAVSAISAAVPRASPNVLSFSSVPFKSSIVASITSSSSTSFGTVTSGERSAL